MPPGEPGLERPTSPASFLGQLSPPASLLGTDPEMSDQEVVYSTPRFLQSSSESQNRLRRGGTQMPEKSDDKEFSVRWHLISRTLGILCLLLLMTVIVLGTMIFQCTQEKHQQDEILQNLRQKQNDSYLKEQLLTNKTLEYDSLKNKTIQHKKELALLLTEKDRCGTIKIFSKSLRNTDKVFEECWPCCGINCYYFTTEYKTWTECKQICQNYGLSLLKIDDADEQTFLQSQTNRNLYWIGLSYNEREKKWEWIDSSTPGLDVKLWNLFSGRGKCAFLSSTRLTRIECSKRYNCICEKRIDCIVSGL
ncbi:killer cell lectin-like receptor 2 [Rhinolophus sinicus]|uniref:killer cell lectin-like receptor 2 n=1 Tax=Rhinolophus sinicus TaxID=89399 RepID=UPI003D7B3FA6